MSIPAVIEWRWDVTEVNALEQTEKRFDLDRSEVELGPHHGSTSFLGGKHDSFPAFRNYLSDATVNNQNSSISPLKGWVPTTRELERSFLYVASHNICVCVCVCAEREKIVGFNLQIWCPRACGVSNKDVFMQVSVTFLPPLPFFHSLFTYLQFWEGGWRISSQAFGHSWCCAALSFWNFMHI